MYDVEEELVAVIPSQQNWKGIGISLIVILSVIGLVAFAVFLMTPTDTGPRIKGARIKLENFTSGIFHPSKFNASWHSGSSISFINSRGTLELLNVETLARKSLVSNNVFRKVGGTEYQLSPELDWVLLRHEEDTTISPTEAKYTMQNIRQGSSSPLLKVGVSELTGWESQEYLQHACWVPGTSAGLILVKQNDIYYKEHPTKENIHRITTDGEPGVVFNGVTDWIYKERVLQSSSSIWLSDSGTWLAYLNINDSLLSSLSFPSLDPYMTASRQEQLRYPKSDGEIPGVSVQVVNLRTRASHQILPPQILRNSSFYVIEVKWISEDILFIAWMARGQNIIVQTMSQAGNKFKAKQILLVESSDFKRDTFPWTNLKSPLFSEDLKMMVMIFPLVHKNFGYFPHIVQRFVSEDQQQVFVPLSQGMFEVTEILAWDHDENIVYFMGNLEDDPGSLHLWETRSNNKSLGFSCVTCALKEAPCSYNKVHISPNRKFFIQECLGPGVPFSRVVDLQTKTEVFRLENNEKLHEVMEKFSLPKIKELSIKLPSSDIPATVRLFLPPGFREEEEFAFPLVMNVDRNSRNKVVTSRWEIGWHTYLSSNRDFIIAHVDARESGLQGSEFAESDAKQLGKRQVEDLYLVLRHLVEKFSFVDTSKIGIHGVRYGGFIAGLLLAKDALSRNPIIKCAITQSPIVEWKSYDAFFTEKHLGQARDKKYWTRYDDSSLKKISENIPSKILYLVHEPGDLTHLEQSMILSRALVDKGILFKQQIYIEKKDENQAMVHMFKSMESHFDDCFGPIEDFFRDDYFLASLSDLP